MVVSERTEHRAHVDTSAEAPTTLAEHCCQWKQVGRDGLTINFRVLCERRNDEGIRSYGVCPPSRQQLENRTIGERERVRGRKRCQNDAECAVNVFDSDNAVRACTSYQSRKFNLACHLDQLILRTRLSEDVCCVPSRVSIVSRDAACVDRCWLLEHDSIDSISIYRIAYRFVFDHPNEHVDDAGFPFWYRSLIYERKCNTSLRNGEYL